MILTNIFIDPIPYLCRHVWKLLQKGNTNVLKKKSVKYPSYYILFKRTNFDLYAIYKYDCLPFTLRSIFAFEGRVKMKKKIFKDLARMATYMETTTLHTLLPSNTSHMYTFQTSIATNLQKKCCYILQEKYTCRSFLELQNFINPPWWLFLTVHRTILMCRS